MTYTPKTIEQMLAEWDAGAEERKRQRQEQRAHDRRVKDPLYRGTMPAPCDFESGRAPCAICKCVTEYDPALVPFKLDHYKRKYPICKACLLSFGDYAQYNGVPVQEAWEQGLIPRETWTRPQGALFAEGAR